MGLHLKKQKLHTVKIELYETARVQYEYDMNICIFLLNEENMCQSKDDFIYYSNSSSHNKAISLNEANNRARIKLNELPNHIFLASVVLNIYDAEYFKHRFNQTTECSITITDTETDKQLASIPLENILCAHTYQIGVFAKTDTSWKWIPNTQLDEQNPNQTLKDLCTKYSLIPVD